MRPDESEATVCQSDATSYSENAGTRAVVLLSRAPRATKPGTAHYHVSSLAQLVATKNGHSQTRERRRVSCLSGYSSTRRTLIAECATVLARVRATDQHAAIPINLDGLC